MTTLKKYKPNILPEMVRMPGYGARLILETEFMGQVDTG